MSDGSSKSAVLVFAAGVALGGLVASLAFAAFFVSAPPPRAPEPTPVVCAAPPPCPACPVAEAPPAPVDDRPEVREPPPGEPGALPASAKGPPLTARECDRARLRPMQVSDDKLADCARQGLLGTCHINGGCPTCACKEYVAVEQLCDAEGKCAYPLSGTGCVSAATYGSGWFNCGGTDAEVAGCMVRKLAKAGYCKAK